MSSQEEVLSEVSNFDLARHLMSILWDIYDRGGISLRRSRRSALLESVTDISRKNWFGDDIDLDILIREAHERPVPIIDVREEMFLDISLISLEHYACLVFYELGKWYKQNLLVEVQPGCYVSMTEKKIWDAIAKLLAVEEISARYRDAGLSCSFDDLVQEGVDRLRAVNNDELRRQGFFEGAE